MCLSTAHVAKKRQNPDFFIMSIKWTVQIQADTTCLPAIKNRVSGSSQCCQCAYPISEQEFHKQGNSLKMHFLGFWMLRIKIELSYIIQGESILALTLWTTYAGQASHNHKALTVMSLISTWVVILSSSEVAAKQILKHSSHLERLLKASQSPDWYGTRLLLLVYCDHLT